MKPDQNPILNNPTPPSAVPAAPLPSVPSPTKPPVPQAPFVPGKKMSNMTLKEVFAKYNAMPKMTKLLIDIVAFFVVIILILFIGVLARGSSNKPVPTPIPTAVPVGGSPLPQVDTNAPSQYATDSAVLKIESDADGLNKEMDSVDLRQSDLRVPTLDFNVKFQ